LALALRAGDTVRALTVDYGQQHRNELDAAARIADHYGIGYHIVRLDPILFAGSALTSQPETLPNHIATSPDTTYVPARNTVLLALAVAYAETTGARQVILGANADDAAAYPDCRPEYLTAFRDVVTEGTTGHVWINAPLLELSKREIVELATGLHIPIGKTWSCYRDGDQPCGRCGACQLRDKALA
jgi:7-cyano-7-deazaguanine synthase